jgi:DNA repair protein RadC
MAVWYITISRRFVLRRFHVKVHPAGQERDIFSCLFLDTRHALIACEDLFAGTIDGATVYPSLVVASDAAPGATPGLERPGA